MVWTTRLSFSPWWGLTSCLKELGSFPGAAVAKEGLGLGSHTAFPLHHLDFFIDWRAYSITKRNVSVIFQ